MTPKDRREIIDEYISDEQKQVDKQYQALIAGSITLAAFFIYLRQKISEWHSVAGAAAYQKMNASRWNAIGDKIQSELDYLKNFQAEAMKSAASTTVIANEVERIAAANSDVPDGLETVIANRVEQALKSASPSTAEDAITRAIEGALADSIDAPGPVATAVTADAAEIVGSRFDDLMWGQIGSRAQMYTDAAFGTYENSVKAAADDAGAVGVRRVCEEDEASCDECVAAASEEYSSMADIPDIGSLTCMCITTPRSRILTARGWVPISQVGFGDFVWTHRARWMPVLRRIVNRPSSEHSFIDLVAPTGEAVGFTSDHRLLTEQGWLPIADVLYHQLSVYNWGCELLRNLRCSNAEGLARQIPLPPMSLGLPLRTREGLSRSRVPFMRDESQGKVAMGNATSVDNEGYFRGQRTPASPVRGSQVGFELASKDGWSPVHLVLGRGSPENCLPLPMGLDSSARAYSSGVRYTSQEPRRDVRPSFESRTEIRNGPRLASRSNKSGTCESGSAEDQMSDLWNGVSGEEAFTLQNAEVLQRQMRETPLFLWDLEVAADHSFIVEGIVAHNSNCRCYFEFDFHGVEPLQIDRSIYA